MQRTLFDAEPQPKLASDSDKQTSHAAAAEVLPKLNRIQSQVMQAVEWSDPRRPLTANEIARNARSYFGGMAESYRKRVHELVRAGLLREAGERICAVTGKRGTVYERVR